MRARLFPHSSMGLGLAPILAAIFVFNLGSGGWSAVVAARLTQDGSGTGLLGVLYMICELSAPGGAAAPALTVHHGARRVTQIGLVALVAVPLIGLSGLDNGRLMAMFVLSALPTMAVYVGMPALVIGASKEGRDGWSLAWLGMAGRRRRAGTVGGRALDGLVRRRARAGHVRRGQRLMLPVATLGCCRRAPRGRAGQRWRVVACHGWR